MSLETINSVDINFSNGGGEHTANVNSTLDVKNSDGSPSLGVVNGEIGEKNYFSKEEINKIMSRFVCTSVSKNRSPLGTTVSRKYSDITSLTLRSYVVLVRGLNAPPDNKDSFEGMFPFFSEVKGSPLDPFPSAGIREMDDKRVIVAGKIYNYESTTVLSGLKVALVYQNGELINDLCLNRDTVTKGYQNAPNLNSYNLKFGYTLNEYIDILNHVGVTHKGLEDIENADKILFQTSGSLADITSAIASFFGFYYFVDPNTGYLNFIDSQIAANLAITDFTKTSDESIISASFTEEKFSPEIVNTYVGSADKPNLSSDEGRFNMGEGKERNLAMFRVNAEAAIQSQYNKGTGEQDVNPKMSSLAYGALYNLFSDPNIKGNPEIFNKYFFLLLLAKKQALANENFQKLDFGDLYPDELVGYFKFKFSKDTKGQGASGSPPQARGDDLLIENKRYIDPQTGKINRKGNVFNELYGGGLPRRFDALRGRIDAFYHTLHRDTVKIENDQDKGERMRDPSDTSFYNFLQGFYEFAGGIYVSSGMGRDRARRINITNPRGLVMSGPFHKNELLANCAGMGALADWLETYTTFRNTRKRVRDLANVAGQLGQDVGDFYYIGLKPWATLPRDRFGNLESLPWDELNESTELRAFGSHYTIGHAIALEDIFNHIANAFINPSVQQFKAAVDNVDKQLQLTYRLGDPQVEEVNQKDEEDKQLVGQPLDTEKLQDLLQRYDLKSYVIDAPKTEEYTPLTVQTSNGSVVEMKALRDAALKEYDLMNKKPLKSSSKTVYGLEVPSEFKVITNSFSIRSSSDGITTTIGESTLKLLPPDRQFVISLGMEAIGTPSINPRLRASQRNYLGL